jgi:glyoxylase-like metal-dependent hydrolase (beta-lactamase superfamily II)
MQVHRIPVGQLEANCYIVTDGRSSDAIIIDPGDDPERIISHIEKNGLRPIRIIFTHAHFDHVGASGDLKRRSDLPVMMHEEERATYEVTRKQCVSWGLSPDDLPKDFKTFREGDRITVGNLSLEVIHTPGHTPGSICLYGNGAIFTGDTLFRGSVGRTDRPGGDTNKLLASLKKIKVLPENIRVLPGHGDETTIGHERTGNPFLNEGSGIKLF